MSRQYRENWKRLANKNFGGSGSQGGRDIVRFEDFMAYSGFIGSDPGINHIQYNPEPVVPTVHVEGCSFWNSDDHTLNLMTETSGTTIQIGQEIVLRGTNRTGTTIPNGSIVYINGAQGNRPTVALASARTHTIARATIGVATTPIENNETGYITTFGLVRDIDTSALFEGAPVFLSVASGLFQAPPVPDKPDTTVFIGIVARSHPQQGILFVKILSQPNLEELSNVFHSGVQHGDMNVWDSGISVWRNQHNLQVDVDTDTVSISGTIQAGYSGQSIGFLGATPITRASVTGSRSGGAALENLLTALDSFGIITDNTTG